MIVLLLEDDGFDVVDNTEFGTTDVIRRAIMNGEIDIYPEYTGNGGFFFSDTDSSLWQDARTAYETVAELDLEENDIVWLEPAPANNTWAIAVRSDLAESEGLETLEDFADYVNDGGDIKLAGSEEFVSRDDALPSFEDAYGFDLDEDQTASVASLYNANLVVPCMFNSGTVIGKRGMTCLEIDDGQMALVHWFDDTRSRKYLNYGNYETEQLPGTDFHRVEVKRDSLDYIFTRITLLAGPRIDPAT